MRHPLLSFGRKLLIARDVPEHENTQLIINNTFSRFSQTSDTRRIIYTHIHTQMQSTRQFEKAWTLPIINRYYQHFSISIFDLTNIMLSSGARLFLCTFDAFNTIDDTNMNYR